MQEPWGRASLCTDPQVGRSREGSPPHPPPRSRGLRGGGGEINVLTSWSRKAGGGGGALPSGSRPVPGSAVTPRPDVLPRENVPSHRPSIPQRPGSGPAWHLSNHLYLDGSRLKAASSRGGGRGAGSLPNLGSPQTCRGRSSCLHPRTPQPTCGTSGDSGGWPDKGLAQGSRGLDRSRGPRATVASTPAARLRGKGRGGGEEMLPTGPICPAPPKARTPGVGSPGPLPAAGEPPSAYLVSRKVRGLGKHLEARAGPGTSSSWSFPTSHQCASR